MIMPDVKFFDCQPIEKKMKASILVILNPESYVEYTVSLRQFCITFFEENKVYHIKRFEWNYAKLKNVI